MQKLIFITLTFLTLLGQPINTQAQQDTKQFNCEDFDYYENDTSIFYLSHQDSIDFLNYVIENKIYLTTAAAAFNHSFDTIHLKKQLYHYFYYYTGHRSYDRIKDFIPQDSSEASTNISFENASLLHDLSHDICVIAKIVDTEHILLRYKPGEAPRLRNPGLYHLQVKEVLYADAKGLATEDTLLLSFEHDAALVYVPPYDTAIERRLHIISSAYSSHLKTYRIGNTYLFFLDLPNPKKEIMHIKKYGGINGGNYQKFCMNIFQCGSAIKIDMPIAQSKIEQIRSYMLKIGGKEE